jgi:hypothetical protein
MAEQSDDEAANDKDSAVFPSVECFLPLPPGNVPPALFPPQRRLLPTVLMLRSSQADPALAGSR